MGRIIRSNQSVRDLLEITSYIARDNVPAADKFVDELNERFVLLSNTPYVGRERADLGRNLRSLPFGQYMIFYRPIAGGIQIARLLHGARDIRQIFKR